MNGLMHDFMEREMDRKDFLKLVGFGLLSIFGLGTFLKMLAELSTSSHNSGSRQTATTQAGYNSGVYVGRPKGKA